VRARRTERTNKVFTLPGGTEDNDLWVEEVHDEAGRSIQRSVWALTDDEREAIMQGANINLYVWGSGHPPVMMSLTDENLKGVSRGC
jgi:hypothetical protein